MADAGIGEAAIASEAGSKGAETAGAEAGAKGAETAGAAGAADVLAPEALGFGASTSAADAAGGIFGSFPGATAGAAPVADAGSSALAFSAPSGITPGALAVDPTAAASLETGAAPLSFGGTTAAANPLSVGGAAGGADSLGGEAALGAGAAPAGASPAASGGFSLDSLVKGAGDSITKNPLGLGLAGAGLGYNILQGQKTSAATDQLKSLADSQGAEGAVLRNYLATGTLPAGLQKSVDAAVASNKARIIANYAQRGLPTDPTKNSALQQELAGAEQAAILTAAQVGQQLMSAGLSESQMSNQLYTRLQQIDQTQSENIGKSIASMAAALGGGGTTIKVGA